MQKHETTDHFAITQSVIHGATKRVLRDDGGEQLKTPGILIAAQSKYPVDFEMASL